MGVMNEMHDGRSDEVFNQKPSLGRRRLGSFDAYGREPSRKEAKCQMRINAIEVVQQFSRGTELTLNVPCRCPGYVRTESRGPRERRG